MANRRDYFFRQRVTEAELDDGFAELERADQNLAGDLGFTGVLANAVVSQHAPVPDLSVDVSGPGAVLDQLGQRIFFSALQNVSVAQDDGGVSTTVSAAGQEKIVSVFVKFDRALSDPRVDGNSLTVFFRRDESFKFIVAQGGQAPAGTALPPPLRSDAILLADITRTFGQTQILNANISTARRQDALVVAGAPRSLRRGRTVEALADLLGYLNAHVNGSADRHPATAVDYAGGGAWADGATNPATTVEAQLDKVISDLAATTGAPKVGAAASVGSPNSLGVGTVRSQLDALLGFINGHINLATGAHAAAAVAYAGGGNWADGTTNPATTLEAQLDKVISDLVAAAGAARIGAAASGNLPAGTIRSQLDALDATSVRTNIANIFTALQTFNGAAGDTNGALATTAAPTTRKLLWEFAINAGYKGRLYSSTSFNGAFEVTINARWDGTQWVRDSSSLFSVKWTFHNYEWRIDVKTGSGNFTDSTWTGFHRFEFPFSAPNNIIHEASGEVTSSGPLTGYSGTEGEFSSNANIGGGASFASGRLPAAPSSVTFTVKSSAGTTGSPSAWATDRMGVGWFAGTAGATPATRYMFLTFTAS